MDVGVRKVPGTAFRTVHCIGISHRNLSCGQGQGLRMSSIRRARKAQEAEKGLNLKGLCYRGKKSLKKKAT